MIDLLWAYVLVFLLAAVPFIESIVIVPIAIVGGLSAPVVLLLAVTGNLITVLIVIVFIERIKAWRSRRKGGQVETETVDAGSKRMKRAQVIWKKYGLPGLALVGPFFVGSHVTAFVSVILGGSRKLVTLWMTISLLLWCTAFALIGYYGAEYLNIDYPFIERLFIK